VLITLGCLNQGGDAAYIKALRKAYIVFENLRGKDHFGDLSIGKNIILNYSKEMCEVIWKKRRK
jgi:hypothetical protein